MTTSESLFTRGESASHWFMKMSQTRYSFVSMEFLLVASVSGFLGDKCFSVCFSGKYFRSRARLRRSKPFVFAVAMSAPQVFSVAEMDDESSDSRRRDERTRSNRRWVASSDAREVKSSAVRRTRSASTGAQPSHQLFCVELRRSAFFYGDHRCRC